MRRFFGVLGVMGFAMCAVAWQPLVRTVLAQGDANTYFNQLTARPDHWKSNSLRSQTLIDNISTVKPNQWVKYDTTVGAAKAIIPAFNGVGLYLGAPVTADADRIVFKSPLTTNQKNALINARGLLIDDEVMTVTIPGGTFGAQFPTDSSLLVLRGQGGTKAAAHASGAAAPLSQNNLLSQLRVPLGTEDGHTYLFTWDVYYDGSYLGADLNGVAVGHKEFQLAAGQKNQIWLETRIRPDGIDGMGKLTVDRSQYVGLIDARSYDTTAAGAVGSNVTKADPLAPQANRFYLRAERWTRFWWFVDQRANAYDIASLWVADENTDPVKVFDSVTTRVYGTPPTIFSWWFEQNTSFDRYRGHRRDLVSYARNFVALKDVQAADVASLLQRPIGDNAPAPPRNLRLGTN